MDKKTRAQLNKLSLEDLEKERQRVDEAIQDLREYARDLKALYDEQAHRAAAEEKLAAMSDTERAALMQVIEAKGIESREAVKGLADDS